MLSAKWGGADNQQVDLTNELNELVNGRSLICAVQFWANHADPSPGQPKKLQLRYRLDGKEHTASYPDTALVAVGTGPPRPKNKRGLVITQAVFGASDGWIDVTAAVQGQVHDNRITSWPVLDATGLPNATKTLVVRYYLAGDDEELANFMEGEPISIGVPAGMQELPHDKWVDVLPLAADADLARLTWTRLEDGIKSAGRHMGDNSLPLPVFLRGDYEIELKCTRVGGGDLIGVAYPVDRNMASVSMGHVGRIFVFDDIGSDQPDSGPLREDFPIESQILHTALIRIGHDGWRATMDVDLDSHKINWKGDSGKLGSNHFTPAAKGQLNVYTHLCEFKIHSLKVRMLKGHGYIPADKKPSEKVQTP